MSDVWIVIVEDRHKDVDALPFSTEEAAVRTARERMHASRAARQRGIAMTSAPSPGTTRRWLKAAEAVGLVRRTEDQKTGERGRPAHMWELTEEGRRQAHGVPPLEVMVEQVRERENARKQKGARQ